MAVVKVFRIRYCYKETVTSGGAFVGFNNTDTIGDFVAATQAAAIALIPAVAAPGGASNTNTVNVNEVTEILSTVTSA